MFGRIPSFFIALVFGSLAEGLLDGLVALFGKSGPCVFDVLSLISGLWHLPGMILCWPLWSLSRPDGRDAFGYAALTIEYVIGGLTFTILFYMIIRLAVRLLRHQKHE